jgi:hypothetical protein
VVHGEAAKKRIPVVLDGRVERVAVVGEPRVGVPPDDEAARGRPAPEPEPMPASDSDASAARPDIERVDGGRLRDGEAARKLAVLAVKARRERAERMALLPSLLRDLRVQNVQPGDFDLAAVDDFVEREAARLAQEFGAGTCPHVARGILQTAALQLQASRLAFSAGSMAEASRLGNDSRQNVLAAHAVAARSGEARGAVPPSPEVHPAPQLDDVRVVVQPDGSTVTYYPGVVAWFRDVVEPSPEPPPRVPLPPEPAVEDVGDDALEAPETSESPESPAGDVVGIAATSIASVCTPLPHVAQRLAQLVPVPPNWPPKGR